MNKQFSPALLCKACQSGKTAEALGNWVNEQIKNKTNSHTRKLGIFICDNSLLLTKQTSIRALKDDAIQGEIVMMSCKERIKHVEKLHKTIIKNPNLTTILCCGNNKRLKDITELLDLLSSKSSKSSKSSNYELFIYIDEADKILHGNNAKKQLDLWRDHPLITQIILITATPEESLTEGLTTHFGELSLVPVTTVIEPTYHRLCDSILFDAEIEVGTNLEYIEQVFENSFKDGPHFGDVWFIPGEYKIETHDEIQKLLFEVGFNAVLKINGKHKEITYLEIPEKATTTSSEPIIRIKTFKEIHEEIVSGADELQYSPYNNELSRWLERYYIRNNGKKHWKFAITGNNCISRGISIQSPGCLITHAIYGPKCAQSQTGQYQMFARVCGNIKQFPSYQEQGPPKIMCSKEMFNNSCRMEQHAMETARLSQLNDN